MTPTPHPGCIYIDGQEICGKVHYATIADILNSVLPFILMLAGIILFLVLVWGGFDFMTSAGNPEKIKTARAKITSAIIGFFLIAFAFGITKLIAVILGFQTFF